MAHNVFISYVGEDGKVAEIVRRTLEDEGIKCWIAPRGVPIGTNYEDAIIDGIAASRVMILIISKSSNKSPHVKREIQNACLERFANANSAVARGRRSAQQGSALLP
jgi:hypothetical protein